MEEKEGINANIERNSEKEKVGEIEILHEFSEDALKNVLYLEKTCFPPEWQYDGAEKYYEEMLKDGDNINIFLKADDKIVGYLLAMPYLKVFKSLHEYDKEIDINEVEDKNKIYLETIQISPDFRGKGGAEKLIKKMCEEGKKRGFKIFSIHSRKSNGLNEKVKRMFSGKLIKKRDLEKWHYGGNEPYEYLEINI